MKFNKLVRDNIPSIIEKNGEKPIVRILDGEEYKDELIKKLLEEVAELATSEGEQELLEELADVREVINAMYTAFEIDKEKVDEIMTKKNKEKGSFEKKVFLESVS